MSELYNDNTGKWEAGPELPSNAHNRGCLVALNQDESKHLLVPEDILDSYTYDWEGTQQWEAAGNRAKLRLYFRCTRVTIAGGTRDVVVVAGGTFGGIPLKDVEIYNIQSNTW